LPHDLTILPVGSAHSVGNDLEVLISKLPSDYLGLKSFI
jgi:hypothetical protein